MNNNLKKYFVFIQYRHHPGDVDPSWREGRGRERARGQGQDPRARRLPSRSHQVCHF